MVYEGLGAVQVSCDRSRGGGGVQQLITRCDHLNNNVAVIYVID